MAEREYGRQTYYPSAKVVLIPRIDEFGGPVPPPPQKRAPIRRGTGKDTATALQVEERDGNFVLVDPTSDPNHLGGPQQQRGTDDYEVVAIPRAAGLGRNGPRVASTFWCEFKYRDLPIDPRVIRSCAVEFYLGTVSAEDFQAGIAGATRSVGDPGSTQITEPLHLIPSEYVDGNGNPRTNLRFQGFVDEWETSWDEGEPVIKLQCTDNTRLLIDQMAPPQLSVATNLNIDEAIAKYLANFPQFRGLQVRFLGSNPPQLKTALAKTAFQPKLGPGPAKGGDSKTSVWDYLTDVTGALGLLIRFEGITIIVQRPRTLMKGTARSERRDDDPFRPRRLPSGRVLERRTFVYGRNIKNVTVRRNFTAYAAFNVEVRCYNGKRKKTLVARFPTKKDRQTDVKPGDSSEQKWTVIRITGIEDQDTLQIIAQGIYESVGRNELNVQFTTTNLASFGGDNDDPDVLDMLPGDSIDIQTTREEAQFASVNEVENILVVEERARLFLETLGFDPGFAAAYAKAFVNVGIQSVFRVRKVDLDWSESDGVTVDVEAVNYVVVRADKTLPEDVKPEPEPEDEATPQDEPVDVVIED